MRTIVNMHDAKSSLSRLVKRAAAGDDIIIAQNGKPVARLTRVSTGKPKTMLGAFKGKIHMAENFDALPTEFGPYV